MDAGFSRVAGRTFLNGLAVVLPVVITVALVWWLGASLERVLGGALKLFVPPRHYVPGLGIAVGVVLVFLAGIATRIWLTRRLLLLAEGVFERIPLAKTVFGSIRDFMRFVQSSSDGDRLSKVVLVTLAEGVQVLGFVTGEAPQAIATRDGREPGDDRIPVFLQMSYQMGGYTVFVERDRVRPVEMKLENAMRWVLTAGITGNAEGERPRSAGRVDAGGSR